MNAENLIVCGAARIDGQFHARAYASQDAGKSWNTTALKIPPDTAYSVNTWMTLAADGTAYYAATCQPAKANPFVVVYHSSDEGRTWSDPVRSPGDSYDQPRMITSLGASHVVASLCGIAALRSSDSVPPSS